MQRFGGFEDPTNTTLIDNLTYSYDPSSPNQLLKVVDLTNSTQGFKDDVTAILVTDDTSDDYAYDVDGNMIKDENKQITNIAYNHLNLPTEIQFTNNRKINYTYDATGVKLKKEVNFGGYSVATDYLNGYQYETKDVVHGGRGYAQLLFFPHTEGYVKAVYSIDVSDKKRYYRYVYNYTDRWNNIRVSYTDDKGTLKVIEENNYYPFGLKHQNYNQTTRKLALKPESEGSLSKKVRTVPSTEGINNYKYNGKELQEELGLNWYDYGARNYQADLGRWMNIDPLAEKYYPISAYVYVANNPLRFIDPNGMEIINGETARRKRLEIRNQGNQKRMNDKYGGNTKLKRKDFESKEKFKKYKSDRKLAKNISKSLAKSIKTEAKIQQSISDFESTDKTNFDLANNLTFKDSSGNEHSIDIIVNAGEASSYGGAVTKTGFTSNSDGSYKSISNITTTLDFRVIDPVSSVLAHETGHAYNNAKNPVKAMKDTTTHNCQDRANRNTFQSKTAMDWQSSYNKLKKKK